MGIGVTKTVDERIKSTLLDDLTVAYPEVKIKDTDPVLCSYNKPPLRKSFSFILLLFLQRGLFSV